MALSAQFLPNCYICGDVPATGICSGVPVCGSCAALFAGDLHGLSGSGVQAIHGGTAGSGSGVPVVVSSSLSRTGPSAGQAHGAAIQQLYAAAKQRRAAAQLAAQSGAGGAGQITTGNTQNAPRAVYGRSPASVSQLTPAQMLLAGYGGEPPPPKLERTPMRVGEVTAYRCWRYTGADGFLRSMSADEVWAPGEAMTARTLDGDMGIHAYKLKRDALKYPGCMGTQAVFGAVALWGEVIEHDLGYRAEYGRVTALDRPRWMKADEFRELCGRYGVACPANLSDLPPPEPDPAPSPLRVPPYVRTGIPPTTWRTPSASIIYSDPNEVVSKAPAPFPGFCISPTVLAMQAIAILSLLVLLVSHALA